MPYQSYRNASDAAQGQRLAVLGAIDVLVDFQQPRFDLMTAQPFGVTLIFARRPSRLRILSLRGQQGENQSEGQQKLARTKYRHKGL